MISLARGGANILLGLNKNVVILKEQHSISMCLKMVETEKTVVVLQWALSTAEWSHCHTEYVGKWVVVS